MTSVLSWISGILEHKIDRAQAKRHRNMCEYSVNASRGSVASRLGHTCAHIAPASSSCARSHASGHTHNEIDHDNLIIPCGRWQGGSLWLQNPDHAHALDERSGLCTMLLITWPFVRFSPDLRHTPWTSGDRTVPIGYVARSLSRLSNDRRCAPTAIGFRLPWLLFAVS